MRRTKEDTEITRKAIVDAAYRVFRRKGYAATTMNDLADEIRMSRGAVYWHFKSKADLFTCLLNESLDVMFENFKANFNSSRTILEKIQDMMLTEHTETRFFELIRNFEPGIADLDSKSRIAAMKVAQKRFQEIFDTFFQYLKAAQNSGQIRASVNIEAFAAAVMLIASMLHAPLSDKMELKVIRLRDRHCAAIADLLFNGLKSAFV